MSGSTQVGPARPQPLRPEPIPQPPLDRRDVSLALLVACAGFALFATRMQTRLTGDGSMLVDYLLQDGGANYPHVLYLPAVRAFESVSGLALLHFIDVLVLAKFFSAVCAAVGLGASFGVARALGADRRGALLASTTVALTPALTFFGTTVEVHALHFALATLGALAVLVAPWRHRAVCLVLAVLLYSSTYLSHQLGALAGLAWVGLVGAGAARSGRPFSARQLLFGVAPLLLLGVLATAAAVNRVQHGVWSLAGEAQREYVATFAGVGSAWRTLWLGWLAPLGIAVPLWLLAVLRPPRLPWARFAAVSAVLSPLVFVVWWGVPERGGYFLASLPLAVGLAAAGLPVASPDARKRLALVWLLALVPQAWWAQRALSDFDRGYDPRERASLLRREAGAEFLVVRGHAAAPDVRLYVHGATELDLQPLVAGALAAEIPPERFVQGLFPALDGALATTTVVLDRSYRGDFERPREDLFLPYVDALERGLRERYSVREVPDEFWPLWVLALR